MPLHHHLPATYLAAFSPASAGPRRARPIVVGDKSDGRVFRTAAQAVAAVQGLYTLNTDGVDPEEIEKLWSRYEDDLGDALDALVAGSTDAVTWARVLVPFVAATLVRGPDFNKRFEARLGSLARVGPTNPDNTNIRPKSPRTRLSRST